MARTPDLVVHGGGTVYLLQPTSTRGTRWISDNLPADALRLGSAVGVEHRFVGDIVAGAVADGLVVR